MIEIKEKILLQEANTIDYKKAYEEMVDENLELHHLIRRYEEAVQTLTTINFITGRLNS